MQGQTINIIDMVQLISIRTFQDLSGRNHDDILLKNYYSRNMLSLNASTHIHIPISDVNCQLSLTKQVMIRVEQQ